MAVDLNAASLEDFGVVCDGKLRLQVEYVSGIQITYAHILAHPDPYILEDLQLGPFPDPDKVSLALLNCMPVELVPIVVKLALDAAPVEMGIVDRFMGTVMFTGTYAQCKVALASALQWLKTHIADISVPEITSS